MRSGEEHLRGMADMDVKQGPGDILPPSEGGCAHARLDDQAKGWRPSAWAATAKAEKHASFAAE